MRVTDIHFTQPWYQVDRPEMRDRRSTVHHDDKASFAPQEVDHELEEGVEGEGFVDIAKGFDPEGGAEGG